MLFSVVVVVFLTVALIVFVFVIVAVVVLVVIIVVIVIATVVVVVVVVFVAAVAIVDNIVALIIMQLRKLTYTRQNAEIVTDLRTTCNKVDIEPISVVVFALLVRSCCDVASCFHLVTI